MAWGKPICFEFIWTGDAGHYRAVSRDCLAGIEKGVYAICILLGMGAADPDMLAARGLPERKAGPLMLQKPAGVIDGDVGVRRSVN